MHLELLTFMKYVKKKIMGKEHDCAKCMYETKMEQSQ